MLEACFGRDRASIRADFVDAKRGSASDHDSSLSLDSGGEGAVEFTYRDTNLECTFMTLDYVTINRLQVQLRDKTLSKTLQDTCLRWTLVERFAASAELGCQRSRILAPANTLNIRVSAGWMTGVIPCGIFGVLLLKSMFRDGICGRTLSHAILPAAELSAAARTSASRLKETEGTSASVRSCQQPARQNMKNSCECEKVLK